ncbi:MAG: transposase [Verrucomicrobia bacterium]|nr:transposase [Verrucomicrobiota bacterium]
MQPLQRASAHPSPPKPGYSALRRHRWSAPGAEYFVTFNLQRPAARLCELSMLAALDDQRTRLELESYCQVRTWVVMPDHLHLLFTLGPNQELSEVLRLFKGRLTPALRHHDLSWQDGYYEHHMRPDEDRLPVFLYIFLNPYRAKLLQSSEKWPGYFCSTDDWNWFGPLTNSEVPFPEWLR